MKPVAAGIDAGAARQRRRRRADRGRQRRGAARRRQSVSRSRRRSRRTSPRRGRRRDRPRPHRGRVRAARGARGRRRRRRRRRRAGAARRERIDMLDIASRLGLPVLLVVGMRLGCLNHALLSARAIRARGLRARRLGRQPHRSGDAEARRRTSTRWRDALPRRWSPICRGSAPASAPPMRRCAAAVIRDRISPVADRRAPTSRGACRAAMRPRGDRPMPTCIAPVARPAAGCSDSASGRTGARTRCAQAPAARSTRSATSTSIEGSMVRNEAGRRARPRLLQAVVAAALLAPGAALAPRWSGTCQPPVTPIAHADLSTCTRSSSGSASSSSSACSA